MRFRLAMLGVCLLAAAPAHAQLAVFDAASVAQEIKSAITEAQQLQQQIQQTQQMVQNARALANLNGLLTQYQISPSDLSATQMRQLFNDVYALTASDPAFAQNARALFGQQYALPMQSSAAQGAFGGLGLSPADSGTLASGYNTSNRDLGQAIQYAGVVNATSATRSQLAGNTQQQISQSMALTDNSEGATLHMILAGQLNGQMQADTALQLQAMQADKLVQDQLRQVERDTAIHQQALGSLQGRQTYVGGAVPSLTANSVSFQ